MLADVGPARIGERLSWWRPRSAALESRFRGKDSNSWRQRCDSFESGAKPPVLSDRRREGSILEKFFVYLLYIQRLLDATADPVPDHQTAQFAAIDKDNAFAHGLGGPVCYV